MRELKFRAWDKEQNKYVTDFVLAPTSPTWGAFPIEHSAELEDYQKAVNEKMGVISTDLDMKIFSFVTSDYTLTDWANYYGLTNYIVEQFIGLKDNNGKEIYEGDLIKVYDWGIKTKNDVIGISCIRWDNEEKGWRYNPSFDIDAYDMFRNVEVIGNIHENGDLIGGIS